MTNEQAIAELQKEHDLIQGERELDGSQFAPALLEALAMAIEALEAQDMTLYMNLPEVSAEEAVEILKRNNRIELLPSAQPETHEERTKTHSCDCISRQAAIDALNKLKIYRPLDSDRYVISDCLNKIVNLPSAQPERTCVNCGRTANNGGWYADGGTRCPIEEHYALPKDGYCHLWEKRNVTDDDYLERRTDVSDE